MKIKKLNEMNQTRFSASNMILTVNISDDWSGIYIDGKLLTDGHSIRYDEVIIGLIKRGVNMSDYKLSSIIFEKDGKYYELREEDTDELNLYNCPENLDELIDKVGSLDLTIKLGRMYP